MQLLRQQHRLRLIRLLGLALAACLALAPGAAASVRCSHTDPPAEELRVVPYEDPRIDLDFASGTVRRKGSRILVLDGLSHAVRCAGPAPTAANTKTILFLQDGLSFATVNLSGGLPAPHVDFRAGLGALAYGFVKGRPAPTAGPWPARRPRSACSSTRRGRKTSRSAGTASARASR